MKASLDAKGCLTVIAETGIEEYALQKWAEGYKPSDPKNCRSSLYITNPTMQALQGGEGPSPIDTGEEKP